ncbi:MAG: thiamine pyrophosphate-dependent dehydrogenase E1 component subunit alpha [Candidatus Desulfofervidus auxilii]|nr:thiamine pyrophosphate-dependent dehydrogenase E1 component subunit alpha [Candidatus Desulfofervidus auxilii]
MYSKNFLISLYKTMLKIRLCEESLVEPILKGKIKTPCHLYTGEEAIATGVCAALDKNDYIFGNHRSHGHYIAKGGNLKQLIAEIYCKETGCSRGRGGSMHVVAPEVGFLGAAPIVAGTISLAVGAALASKIRGDKRVSVSFFGDGATGEGVFYESLNFAALKKLPIIFACENNFYSTHMPLRECRFKDNIYESGIPFGVPSYKIDGNNVLEVYEATKKAVEMCRIGEGPVLLEFVTYRLRGHVGPDDNIQGLHTDIRPKEEVEEWKKKDPLEIFKTFLLKKQVLTKDEIDKMKFEIESEVKEAHLFAQKSPYPNEKELCKYVFKEN